MAKLEVISSAPAQRALQNNVLVECVILSRNGRALSVDLSSIRKRLRTRENASVAVYYKHIHVLLDGLFHFSVIPL